MIWTSIFLTDALCEESPEALFVRWAWCEAECKLSTARSGQPLPDSRSLFRFPHGWHHYDRSYLAHASSGPAVPSVSRHPQFLLPGRQFPSPFSQVVSPWPSRACFCKSAYTLWALLWDKALAQLAIAEGGAEKDMVALANCSADAAEGP